MKESIHTNKHDDGSFKAKRMISITSLRLHTVLFTLQRMLLLLLI